MTTKPGKPGKPGPFEMQTASGKYINLLQPCATHINSNDIATHLAKLCRFAGACRGHYSVAQHSILVSDITLKTTGCFETAMRALLHDAHEAYTGDLIRPVKMVLSNNGSVPDWNDVEAKFDDAILLWFGMERPSLAQAQQIETADLRALATEQRDLMPPGPAWPGLPAPWPRAITPWPWQKAEEKWLEKFEDLEAMVQTGVAA